MAFRRKGWAGSERDRWRFAPITDPGKMFHPLSRTLPLCSFIHLLTLSLNCIQGFQILSTFSVLGNQDTC